MADLASGFTIEYSHDDMDLTCKDNTIGDAVISMSCDPTEKSGWLLSSFIFDLSIINWLLSFSMQLAK